MIVEFIGTTGAGKTSLIERVHSKLADRVAVTSAAGLVTGLVGLGGVTNPTAQNLAQEIIGLPFFIFAFRKHRQFIGDTVSLLSRQRDSCFDYLNNLRSIERKLGVNEILRRTGRDRVVLVDEGPILVAHMFAFAGAPLEPKEIARFAANVPLPDLVVYVRAPVDVIVRRTMERPDPPRQLRSGGRDTTEKYARCAVAMFDELVKAENIQSRLLTFDSAGFNERAYSTMVDELSEQILRRRTMYDRRELLHSS